MAFLPSRILGRNVRNQIAVATRFFSDKLECPDPEELATGVEKAEMMMLKAGNDDPFRMKAVKRTASSRSNPTLVPSYYDCRVLGCICEKDSAAITWMWLFKGEPKRCECGHWYKLVEYKPFEKM